MRLAIRYIGLLIFCSLCFYGQSQGIGKTQSQTQSHKDYLVDKKLSDSADALCQLTIAYSEWPPYHFTDSSNRPSGIQVDLLKSVAKIASCELNFRPMLFTQSLIAVERGSIDVTMNATLTEKRKQFGYFSEPFRNETLVLYVNDEFSKNCGQLTIEELIKNGFVLGLQEKLVYGDVISTIQQKPELNKKIKYFEDVSEDPQFLTDNNLDGTISDPLVVHYMSRIGKFQKRMTSCHITVSSSPVSLLFSKKNVSKDVVDRFNQAIISVKKSDEYLSQWVW